jgi:Sec-independent protein translocase protein TatA
MFYILAADDLKKTSVVIINKWMYLSILELLVILFLLIVLIKKKQVKPEEFYVGKSVKEFKDTEIDLGNMFDSMFNAQKLHKKLKLIIHPDRFPNDPEKIKIATELTARLNESQNNISKMKEIQALACEKLGIVF